MMLVTAIVAALFPIVNSLARSRADGQLDLILWLTDPLVLVTPVCVIAIGLLWSILSSKAFHAIVLIVAAPIFGVLICQVYGWKHYQSVVVPTTTVAVLVAIVIYTIRKMGFRFVRQERGAAS